MAVTCSSCGKSNPDEAIFCKGCGTKLPSRGGVKCIRCGLENPEHVQFCGRCGADLERKEGQTMQSDVVSLASEPTHFATTTYEEDVRPTRERLMAHKINLRTVFVHEPEGVRDLHVDIDELVAQLDNLWIAIDDLNQRLDELEKKGPMK
jgi:predicted amidophosphoribosyltransferase